jgi:rod shape-determining protein MreB
VVSGLPIEMEVTSAMVYEGIKDDLSSLCNSIRMILEKVPPELAKDIVHSGIYLTGGSSQISDLAQLFTDVTNIRVNTSEHANDATVLGLKKVLTDAKFSRFGYSMKTRIFK